MELSSDFIKRNHHFLKSCILYEVLQKRPIFDSYRNFCDTVGKDAMEYQDFEFWYYRFYQGELVFDYDRSGDPEPKAIVDMPVVLMKKITQHLDSIERARLRYMNHAIKAVADSFPLVMEKIDMVVNQFSIGYENYETKSSEAEKSIEHMAPVLRMPNFKVNHLSFKFFDATLYHDDLLPVPLNAKSAFIYGPNTNQIVQSLSAMNPGQLESICLDGLFSREREHYGRILETDQFKQAKHVDFAMMEFNVADLVHFSHLKSFKFRLRSENIIEDVPRMRDIISTFEHFESCKLEYMGASGEVPIVAFAMALGEEIQTDRLAQGEHRTITHLYQIPESYECLEINLEDIGYYRCRINIIKIH